MRTCTVEYFTATVQYIAMSRALKTGPEQPQAPTRTLSAADLAGFLRVAVGLPPLEDGAAVDRTPITIDAEAWAAWCLAGLRVCAPPGEPTAPQDRRAPWVPRFRDAVEAGRRFAANFAFARRGSITHAALGSGTSRRALRETLKRAGTYQPPAHTTSGEDGGTDAL